VAHLIAIDFGHLLNRRQYFAAVDSVWARGKKGWGWQAAQCHLQAYVARAVQPLSIMMHNVTS